MDLSKIRSIVTLDNTTIHLKGRVEKLKLAWGSNSWRSFHIDPHGPGWVYFWGNEEETGQSNDDDVSEFQQAGRNQSNNDKPAHICSQQISDDMEEVRQRSNENRIDSLYSRECWLSCWTRCITRTSKNKCLHQVDGGLSNSERSPVYFIKS